LILSTLLRDDQRYDPATGCGFTLGLVELGGGERWKKKSEMATKNLIFPRIGEKRAV